MSDITEFQMTVTLPLLQTLRMGLAQLMTAVQLADATLTASYEEAKQAAKVDPAPDPAKILEAFGAKSMNGASKGL